MAELDDRFLNVNEHGVLRIPFGLWLSVLVLSRGWVVALFVMASLLSNQFDVLRLLGKDSFWITMLIEIPALAVLWLFSNRSPDAGPMVRGLWPKARLLMYATALGNLAYTAWYLWHSSYWLPWPELFMASCCLIDAAVCWGAHSSKYLREVFGEFPESLRKEVV